MRNCQESRSTRYNHRITQGKQNNMIHCQMLEMFRKKKKHNKPHFLFSTNDLCELSAYYLLECSICIWKYNIEIYSNETNIFFYYPSWAINIKENKIMS